MERVQIAGSIGSVLSVILTLTNPGPPLVLPSPLHRELGPGLLRNLIHHAD